LELIPVLGLTLSINQYANVAPCVKLVSINKSVCGLHSNPASAVMLRVACHTEHLYKHYSLQHSLVCNRQGRSTKINLRMMCLCVPLF